MPNTFRRPAPRPPPPFNPAVESWLEAVPLGNTKPSKQELWQWDLKNQYARRRTSYIVSVVLRSLSLTFATVLVCLTSATQTQPGSSWTKLIAVLIPSVAVIIWDAADFITLCIRRDQGISPKVHFWVDALIFLGASVATAFVLMHAVFYGCYSYYTIQARLNTEITKVAFLIGLMFLHSILYFFFACKCLDVKNRNGLTPRIMYLPTGEPVVVTASPYPLNPSDVNPAIELRKLQMSALAAPAQQQAEPASQVLAESPSLVSPVGDEPQSAALSIPSPRTEAPLPPLPTTSAVAIGSPPEPFRNGVPPRKPVLTGTTYAAPWMAPDHEPDEEERARAVRGESQAQWMSLHDMGVGITARGQAAAAFKS